MTNANQYVLSSRLADLAKHCGFMITVDLDQLVLKPAKDQLLAYNENATIARGSVEELTSFLYGWLKFKEYVIALGAIKSTTIENKEKNLRNKKLLQIIKESGANDESVPF